MKTLEEYKYEQAKQREVSNMMRLFDSHRLDGHTVEKTGKLLSKKTGVCEFSLYCSCGESYTYTKQTTN